ncbi:ABC transporter substrate-binding protein [Pontivivens insulae]|uniref:ABC transporter-binding protein n=1 Tax=Pontivivens insulae TaxID=1639689 RepID=A0A2R8AG53_9RHOB|nr:ABC transporter substrate-binding protein [Pontivivens insulae]RED10612.1 multiple sugar transport system substrate-binding protein [Pontivivens insulae]SPF31177.1 hypothetical protein POI8812_03528 [Pontivivens insulae]
MDKCTSQAVAFALGVFAPSVAMSQGTPPLQICWAEWDPALYLFDLSKEFTVETDIQVDLELVPWTSFADVMISRLEGGDATCDIMIGDSQWIGLAAEEGHYEPLNSFLSEAEIDMEAYLTRAVDAYSAWPKGSANYYALPAMGDALGWVYRQDWFERPGIAADFQNEHGRPLRVPASWQELLEVAQFFQGREIDGQVVSGAAIYDERASEGITMGYSSALYAWDGLYELTPNSYEVDGAINATAAVNALEFYKILHDTATPADLEESYMVGNLDAYSEGRVAMQMNWFAFFPGIHADRSVGRGRSGFFANPGEEAVASTLGGQGMSIVSSSSNKDAAYQFLEWFSREEIQQKWWDFGGYSVHRSVLERPGFEQTRPFAEEYVTALSGARDFWQEPEYEQLLAAMQARVHDYVVRDVGTAQEALDQLARDWQEIFAARAGGL